MIASPPDELVFRPDRASPPEEQCRPGAPAPARSAADLVVRCAVVGAYATEAALGVLILAGSRALSLSLLITLAIIALISVVVLSYRQVIAAYPEGGGSYVVAHDNLGRNVGLVAAAALWIDYVLTAAVSLMAGGQAISSLLPSLLPHEVALSLLLLAMVGWAKA